MFKFDGVAGNPKELGMEMEAMLRTIAALRSKTTKDKDDDDDVWCLRFSESFNQFLDLTGEIPRQMVADPGDRPKKFNSTYW